MFVLLKLKCITNWKWDGAETWSWSLLACNWCSWNSIEPFDLEAIWAEKTSEKTFSVVLKSQRELTVKEWEALVNERGQDFEVEFGIEHELAAILLLPELRETLSVDEHASTIPAKSV